MFTIGDFARHGRVSVRMLRHYDAIGLLLPGPRRPRHRLPVLRGRPARPAEPHHRAQGPRLHAAAGASRSWTRRSTPRSCAACCGCGAPNWKPAIAGGHRPAGQRRGEAPVDREGGPHVHRRRRRQARPRRPRRRAQRGRGQLRARAITPVIRPLYAELCQRLGRRRGDPGRPGRRLLRGGAGRRARPRRHAGAGRRRAFRRHHRRPAAADVGDRHPPRADGRGRRRLAGAGHAGSTPTAAAAPDSPARSTWSPPRTRPSGSPSFRSRSRSAGSPSTCLRVG